MLPSGPAPSPSNALDDVDLAMEATDLAGSGSPPRPILLRSPPPPYDISTAPAEIAEQEDTAEQEETSIVPNI